MMTNKEKKEFAIANLHKMCEDCGWFNDCPASYACPPMQIIIEVLEEIEVEDD